MIFGSEKDLEITKLAVQSRALAPTRISPNDVPHQQEECVPGGGAEIGAIDGDLGWVPEKRGREQRNGAALNSPLRRGSN